MRALVTGALPAESRPYVDIVLDEVRVGATVWARASFAAMAISELVAAIDLFPKDGSPPGVTAYFHYGFGWGYGAGWGVITNVGFDLKGMLRRMSDQAELDLKAALEDFRKERNLAPNSDLALATELAEVLLPLTLDAVVSWCEQQLDAGDAEQLPALGDSLAEAVRTLLADAILPRLLSFAGEKVIENVAHVPAEAAHEIWGELAAASVYLAGASDDPGEAVEAAAPWRSSGSLSSCPQDVGVAARQRGPLRGRDRRARERLRRPQPAGRAHGEGRRERDQTKVLAGLVLGEELAELLEEQSLIPAWISPLSHSVAAVVATLASDDSGAALTSDEAVDLLHSLLTGLDDMMTDEKLWDDWRSRTGFPALVQSMKAQTRVLIELCESLKDGERDRRARHARGRLGRDHHADRAAARAGHLDRGRAGARRRCRPRSGRWPTRSTSRARRPRSTPAGKTSRSRSSEARSASRWPSYFVTPQAPPPSGATPASRPS